MEMATSADKALSAGPRVRQGSSCQASADVAVRELAEAIDQPDIGLIIVFVSINFDLDQLASALITRFGTVTVIGCTTAGEIGPSGSLEGSLSGVSIHKDDLAFRVALMDVLPSFDVGAGRLFAHKLKEDLRRQTPDLAPENTFSFMLIDGLCGCEEVVTRAFYDGLGGIPLVGGSAGDNGEFKKTWLLYDGRFVSNAALLLVASTPFIFDVFKTQHFLSTEARMIVTRAIPEKRIVTEINGCPAAEEYAAAVGIELDRLNSMVFAAHPVVVRIGDTDFVRSIQKMNPDGSLTFYCAIDEGIVFKVAKGVDMIDNLQETLAAITYRIGEPSLILGCNCILRDLEAKQRGFRPQVGALLAEHKVIGFNTYGEQYAGMHINQTFSGVALGRRRRF